MPIPRVIGTDRKAGRYRSQAVRFVKGFISKMKIIIVIIGIIMDIIRKILAKLGNDFTNDIFNIIQNSFIGDDGNVVDFIGE